MWGRHYEQLLNNSSIETSKITVLNSFRNVLTHVGMQVTMEEISMIVNDLTSGKSSGFDGLNSETRRPCSVLITVNLFYMYVYTLLYAIFHD